MEDTKLVRRIIWLLTLTSLTIFICYFLIDKQVAIWISQHHLRSFRLFKYLSQLPELFLVGSIFIYIFIIVCFSYSRWSLIDYRLLMFANVIAITFLFKDLLKYLFGRYWPETWINNNPSLISNHQYGFHFFHFGIKYGAFPSGHTAILFAGVTMLWFLCPKLRLLYATFTIAAVIGIVAMNYHFVGDVIAGGVLGYLIALSYFVFHQQSGNQLVSKR